MEPIVDDFSKVHPGLSASSFPSSSGKVVQITIGVTQDTLQLGYEEYSDPGLPAGSKPTTIVLIPGTPGSRFFTHPVVKQSGYLAGFRLLVLERPGIGLSDPWPKQASSRGAQSVDVAAFAEVLEAFCAALGLERVFLVAYSAGTPYALAAACKCRKELVQAVAVVGAIAPYYPGIRKGMALFFQFGYWACTAWPWFVSWIVRGEGRAGRRKPLASLREQLSVYASSKGDKECLARADVEALFLESLLETGSRFQEETVLSETLRVARPWGFKLADIQVPVGVWQGEQDLGCTKGMAEHLRTSIPGCHCTIVQGKGHMAWFEDAVLDEVVEWLGKHHAVASLGQ